MIEAISSPQKSATAPATPPFSGRACSPIPRALPILIALFLTLTTTAQIARADAVKLGGFWIENVRIIEITPELVLYSNAVGEFSRPAIQLEGLRLESYPQIEQAEAELAKGPDAAANQKKALQLYNQARRAAREIWLKHYLNVKAMGLEESLGQNVDAATSFLALARDNADIEYLKKPPVTALQSATDDDKRKIVALYERALPRLTGPSRAVISRIAKLITPPPPPPAPPANPAAPANRNNANPPAPAPAAPAPEAANNTNVLAPLETPKPDLAGQSDILLPVGTPPNDPVADLLYQNKIDDAIAMLGRTLNGSGARMSMRLYQLGIARLAQARAAEEQGDADAAEGRYKEAGVNFARVIFHFPDTTTWVGPSLVELGHVHQKIGRADKAADLFNKALLTLDEEEDPDYVARVQTLQEASE